MYFASQIVAWSGSQHNYYFPDNLKTAVSCLDQYKFINPTTKRETAYTSLLDLTTPAQMDKSWGLTPSQLAAMNKINWSLGQIGGVAWPVYTLGAQSLLANKMAIGGLSPPLPNDQWTHEVGYWFDISLAMLQNMVVEVATGPADTKAAGIYNSLPRLAAAANSSTNYTSLVCAGQKVHDSNYVNFHASGFIAFLVLGFAVIFSPLLIIPAIQKFILTADKCLAWIEDDKLQLQRMAHEGACGLQHHWERADKAVPIPRLNDTGAVGVLDTITDPHHPVLVPPPPPIVINQPPVLQPQTTSATTSATQLLNPVQNAANQRPIQLQPLNPQPYATATSTSASLQPVAPFVNANRLSSTPASQASSTASTSGP